MSQHPSLRVGGKIRKIRNVMKRYERLNVLRAEGRIPEDKVLGLPKTKPIEVWSGLTIMKNYGTVFDRSVFF